MENSIVPVPFSFAIDGLNHHLLGCYFPLLMVSRTRANYPKEPGIPGLAGQLLSLFCCT